MKKFNNNSVLHSRARRCFYNRRTETNYVSNQAELDGKKFPVDRAKAGVNLPPMHPYCRSTTVAVIEDGIWEMSVEEPGLNEDVPFEEWLGGLKETGDGKVKYVGVDKSGESGIIKDKENIKVNLGELDKVYNEKHSEAIAEILQKAPKNAKAVWNDCSDDFHIIDPNYKGKKAHYDPNSDGILLNISSASKKKSFQAPYQVLFHESGHHIDYILNRKYYSKGTFYEKKALSEMYKGGLFGKTLKEEGYAAVKKFADENGFDLPKTRTEIPDNIAKTFCLDIKNKLTEMQRADISDMFEPIMPKSCSYPFDFGHGVGYWGAKGNGKEGFAEIFSALVSNPESLEQIKKYFPESYKIFEEMLEVINK